MIRFLSYLSFILAIQLLYGQLTMRPLSHVAENRSEKTLKDINPGTLPFWDDFSISGASPDSLRIWGTDTTWQWDPDSSEGVFINSTLAITPPTYRVATFDGLDSDGNVYSRDNTAIGFTDRLVSTSIDLSSMTDADDIYISFYWQAAGNVEIPDNKDSLFLEFLDPGLNWDPIWKQGGGEELSQDQLTEFTHVVIRVPGEYLHSEFRFRFQSYGDQDGPFDAWHVDWIYLNSGRSLSEQSTGYRDGGFSGDLSSPFAPFHSMPANQFGGDPSFIRNQEVEISSVNVNVQPDVFFSSTIDYRLINTGDTTVIVEDLNRGYPLLFNPRLDTTISLMLSDDGGVPLVLLRDQDFSSVVGLDSVVLRSEMYIRSVQDPFLDMSVVDLRVNDTLRKDYLLHDYYAYDDGTAEFAAGTNVKNGQVAIKFWVQNTDTLTHVDINFPTISPIPPTIPTVRLKIMGSLDEEIVLRSQQIDVVDTARNAFKRYALNRPLIVSDTFYLGWQQTLNDYIGVGFDRNNPEASQYIFENRDGDWVQNVTLQGALMIRPVFKSGVELTLGTERQKPFSVYPNPSNGIFTIREDYEKMQLLDMSGRILLEENRQSYHDASKFEQGLYLLRIFTDDQPKVQKIILK